MTKNCINGAIKNFILGHCIFGFKISLPIDTKASDSDL